MEEVDGIDLGQDLESRRVDPDKELQYADLEHFQKPENLPPANASYTQNNNTVDDEPVREGLCVLARSVCVCMRVCVCV